MKTNYLLFGLLAATMLLTACGKDTPEELFTKLDGTIWYIEKAETYNKSEWAPGPIDFWWYQFHDGKYEDWNEGESPYVFNAAERKIKFWGGDWTTDKLTSNEMLWTMVIDEIPRTRWTFKRVQPINANLLVGTWTQTNQEQWNDRQTKWEVLSVPPLMIKLLTFSDEKTGKCTTEFRKIEMVVDFSYEVKGNAIHDKENFTLGSKAFITELTTNRMTVVWRKSGSSICYQYTFTKQK